MWKDHFIPTANYVNSDYLAQGNTFSSGHVAMTPIHTWYTCCMQNVNWNVAAMPAYNGNITAKLHADTFSILKRSKNPDAAFQVLTLMLGEFAPDLLAVYGAFPARQSLQSATINTLKVQFPGVDFQVFIDSLSYPDHPNHESGMPNFLKATDRYMTFDALYKSRGDLNLDKEIDKLITDLDATFQTK
jgi:multiple sugar transport system substrate-binding protein